MTVVRCPTCHRIERWKGDEVAEVVQVGGSRRPAGHPALAAWRILHGAHVGKTGPVVAGCAACELPMVAEELGPRAQAEWRLQTPAGEVVVTDVVLAPSGPMSWADADAWLTAELATHEDHSRAQSAGEVLLMGLMGVPFLLWFVALFMTFFFFWAVADGWLDITDLS